MPNVILDQSLGRNALKFPHIIMNTTWETIISNWRRKSMLYVHLNSYISDFKVLDYKFNIDLYVIVVK